MVGLPCLVSQCAKLHAGGWTWAVSIRVYLELCTWPVAIFTMDQRKKQQVCIKFYANLGKSATETLKMIQQGFEDQSLSRTQVFQWHTRFKTGHTSVDDDEHTGRPTSCTTPETVARIQQLIRQDRRRTICSQICAQDPDSWPEAAARRRLHWTRQLASNDETFLSRVITGDESWVYGYDPETKWQSSQWKSPASPRPKTARQVKSNLKSMIVTFFDIKEIVHKVFVPLEQILCAQCVNSRFYCKVLRRLRENVRRPVAYREGGFGVFKPPPPKFRRFRRSPRSNEQKEPASRFSFEVHCVLIRL